MNVAHTETVRPSTTAFEVPSEEKPDTAETITSLRRELDALHGFVRALVPLARPAEMRKACGLGESAIRAYADAMHLVHELEVAGDVADVDAAAE